LKEHSVTFLPDELPALIRALHQAQELLNKPAKLECDGGSEREDEKCRKCRWYAERMDGICHYCYLWGTWLSPLNLRGCEYYEPAKHEVRAHDA